MQVTQKPACQEPETQRWQCWSKKEIDHNKNSQGCLTPMWVTQDHPLSYVKHPPSREYRVPLCFESAPSVLTFCCLMILDQLNVIVRMFGTLIKKKKTFEMSAA